MSIPSDFDPLAWGERRYIQPILKGAGGNKGVTNESYPYTFKMEVDGTSDGGQLVFNAFRDDHTFDIWHAWGAGQGGDYYAIMTFEHPLRIVGLQMWLVNWRFPSFELYGISEGDDPVTEGTLLGGFVAPGSTSPLSYYCHCLATANRSYYKQYRIDFHHDGHGWNFVFDIKLDAYYRPADL